MTKIKNILSKNKLLSIKKPKKIQKTKKIINKKKLLDNNTIINKQQLNNKHIKLQSIKLLHKFTLNNDNNNLNYTSVFLNKKNYKDLIFLKKISFDIFFSKKYKYPLLVRELLTNLTGKTDINEKPIKRGDIPDPWDTDNEIPLKYNFTVEDYNKYQYYGGSPGHNAPSSWHKLNANDNKQTFLFTNITPQNYSLNSGYWVCLENWCKKLQDNIQLTNINIFTGSIPNAKTSLFYNVILEKLEMNVPTYMFKIICFNHLKYPGITFIDIIIFKNKSYKFSNEFSNELNNKINNKLNNKLNNKGVEINKIHKINFIKYILPIKSYQWFANNSNINLIKLLQYYNIKTDNIKSFKNIINLNLYITSKISHSYIKNNIEISIISEAKSLEELYYNTNLDDIKPYIWKQHYFYKIRNKLIRDKILYTNITDIKKFNTFFNNFKNELTIKYIIDKDDEFDKLGVTQDDYLNIYYNIIKQKLEKQT